MAKGAWFLAAIPLLFFFYSPAEHLDYSVGIILLHALHLLFVFGTGLYLFLLGRFVLGLAGLLPMDRWERTLLFSCTGFLFFSIVLFVLAALGALHPLVIWGWVVLSTFVANQFGSGDRESDSQGGGYAKVRDQEVGWVLERMAAWAFGGLLGLLFLGGIIEALYPTPQSPDGLSANLSYARLFAESGGFRFTPGNPFYFSLASYWELFLASIAVFVRSDISFYVLAQLFHLVLGFGGSVLGIICLVRRIVGEKGYAPWALALFGGVLFAGMRPDITHVRLFPFLIFTAKSDLVVVALQVAATLVMFEVIIRSGRERMRMSLLMGGLLGVGAGIKLTGGIAALGLAAAFWLMAPVPIPVRERLRVTAWTALGLSAILAPLFLKNALAMGNPVYPLLSSFFGRYENPLYFQLFIGFGEPDMIRALGNLSALLFPSVPFILLLAIILGRFGSRAIRFYLLSSIFSILVIGLVFSANFPLRYALFVSALCAAVAACVAGRMVASLATLQNSRGGKKKGIARLVASHWALPVAWMVLFILAVSPTHIDNRLKRAIKKVKRNPTLNGLFYRMSPTSRFQSRWPGRLSASDKPLSLYRPELLSALTRGWFPAVPIHDPALVRLFTQGLSAPELERALAGKGITHIYFETKTPVPHDYPLQPVALVAHLRKRPPFMRADGFEMYAIGKTPDR